jgi:hypothetical protein
MLWKLLAQKCVYFVFIFFVVVLTGCTLAPQAATPSVSSSASLDLSRLFEMEPNPKWSPDQVVKIQIEALGKNNETDRGIDLTFKFASPANKRFTGPLNRFTRMIKSNYSLMLDYQTADYEKVEIVGDKAIQRVRLTRVDGLVVVYRFDLSKQTDESCLACWMTDSVIVEGAYQLEQKQI